jgi:glycosyltransferase involved in cell wall biosynthesis
LLGVPLSGIYHTDFPLYVRTLTQDEALEQLTWRYMYWFYEQMDTIYVPSEVYRRQLIDNGFDRKKLHVLTRGVDLRRFSPAKRDAGFWPARGTGDGLKFIYVGRVSKEKNLDLMLEAFVELRRESADVEMLVVGDGPYLAALEERYRRPDIIFTGFLEGEALAAAYAGADVFVFPSTTDTFGNVVLEAQASGLPVIVSNRGGPAEIVSDGESGMIFDAAEPGSLKRVMRRMLANPELRFRLSSGALENAGQSSWQQVLDDLWDAKSPASATTESYRRIRESATPGLFSLEVA